MSYTGKKKRKQDITVRIIWFFNFLGIAFIVFCFLLSQLEVDESGLTYSQLYFDEELSIYKDTIPASLLGLMDRNPETKEFVLNYPDREKYDEDLDLSEALELAESLNGAGIPLFLQWDHRWGYEKYGDDFIAVTGCGPTCLSMIRCGLAKDTNWNPNDVAKMAEEDGYYVDGAGSSWELMESGARELGLAVHTVVFDEEHIKEFLLSGKPIICAVRPGDFTTSGHFIVLAGVDESGGIIVNDPNSIINSEKIWEMDELIPQIKNLWGYSYER